MNKVVTIHQPNYLPWLGFFSKVKKSECFVILDNVEYTKNCVINRNRIRTMRGWCYLTIPIEKKYYNSGICDVKLPEDNRWQKNHWKSIEANYSKAEYFNSYRDFFYGLYRENLDFLWQINEKIIIYLMDCFGINVEIVKASSLDINPKLRKTDLLIEVLKNVGAETYISGPSGRGYLEPKEFRDSHIYFEFFEFTHPVYKQRYPRFEPGMAAIDLLFNLGEKSKGLI